MRKIILRTEIEKEIEKFGKPGSGEMSLIRAGGQWLGRDKYLTNLGNALSEKRVFRARVLKKVLELCPEDPIPVRKVVAVLPHWEVGKEQIWTVYGEKVMASNRTSSRNTLRLIILDGETPEERINATNWKVVEKGE